MVQSKRILLPLVSRDQSMAKACFRRFGECQLPREQQLPVENVIFFRCKDGVWDVLDDQIAVDLVWDLLGSAQDRDFTGTEMHTTQTWQEAWHHGRTHDVGWLVCCKKQRNLSCRLPKIAAPPTT